MKTIQSELTRIKEFIEKKLSEHGYVLKKEPSDEDTDKTSAKYAAPVVYVGNLPHANFNGDTLSFFKAPYILVGYDESTYDYESENIPILIQCCVYSSDFYVNDPEDEDYNLGIPDSMGVLDATSLMENILNWMREDANFPIHLPAKIGNYTSKAITYPYAFAYLSFEVNTNIGELSTHFFEEELEV